MDENPQRRQHGSSPVVSRRGALFGGAAIVAALGAAADDTLRNLTRPSGPTNHQVAAVSHISSHGVTDLRVRWRADTTARRVALTFDDGPDPAWTPRVLELLGRYSARATFFNVGHNARRHPALTAACAQNGEVGNHSLNHPDLTTLSRDAILRQLRDTHQILTDIVGTPPRLFRPPYGNISGPVLEIAARLGYETILWTDRVQSGGPTVRADVDAVMSRMSPGAIVMGHDGRRNRQGVLDRLPGLLERLTSEGYTCVTVSDLEPAV